MKFKSLLLILFLSFNYFVSKGQNLSFTTKLPIVYINTNGENILDDPRILAKMEIVWNEDGVENSTSDSHNHFNGDVKVEVRGSSSQMFPKKSYGFELKDELEQDMDFPLLGMPEEEDWILYAPYTDKSLIRNMLTFTLASQISNNYVPRGKFVELFLNEKYEGVYVLMENIKRDSVRIDIAKLKIDDIAGEDLTGGYIVKVDKTTGGSGDGWYSDFFNKPESRTFYQYEYPKAGEIQNQQKEYIEEYINEFESAVFNEEFDPETGYSSYINPESFIDYIISNEISKNVDGYRLSTFLYKDKNDKLNAGPLWDFNLGYGNANYYNGWETSGLQLYANLGDDNWQNPFWWKGIMLDPFFTHPLKCRWELLRENELSNQRIIEVTDSLVSLLTPASVRNFERWPILDQWVWPNYFVGDTYLKEINWLKDWIRERLQWLDFALPGDCTVDPLDTINLAGFTSVLYPNPFSSKLQLRIESDSNLTVQLQLFNSGGQLVYKQEHSVTQGLNEIKISADKLGKGVYVCRLIKGETEVAVSKVVKF